MKKYADLAPPDAAPALHFALPALHYPERLNAVETVLEGAKANGWLDRTAFIDAGTPVSYADTARQVHRFSAAFRSLGIGAGDVVILRIPDSLDLVCALLAVQAIGAIAMPTYIQLRADDLIYRVDDAGAKMILSATDLLDDCRGVAEARPEVTIVSLSGDPDGRFASFADALVRTPDDPPPTYADTHAEDLCLFLYTSGSTGAPKGTVHCHRDMLAICDSYWKECIGPTPDDVLGGPPSIAFALGFGMFVYFPLRFGHSAVLDADKSPETALKRIQDHGVTLFAGVVSYMGLLARLIADSGADVSSIRHAMTGGEPLPDEIERGWRGATGGVLEQFIGTTEMLHCFLTSTHPSDIARTGTLGYAAPGYDVAVLDPDSFEELPDGEHGLLATRGPTGTVYWNKPEQQAAAVRNGWCIFQDVVWRDADGYFHYVARHDEMIVTAGYNVSPVQVEEALLKHDAVLECACVPAPDPTGARGAIVMAYVVPASGVSTDAVLVKALQDHVKAVAPPYTYPRRIAFERELPKTINGKVLRSELRARAASTPD